MFYSILIATAWKQLKALLESLGVQAAGLIVLHTWNQRLGHHAHLHVLIPCGALSLDGSRWLEVDQRPQLKAGNQWTLGKRFRTALVQQIQKLAACGKLNLSGKLEFLQDPEVRRDWLAGIAPMDFASLCSHRRATTPIRRSCSSTWPPMSVGARSPTVAWCRGRTDRSPSGRSKERPVPGQRREKVDVTIPETEFVRRWALHVLPKGFTRVRHYGQTGNRNCQAYLRRCREVRGLVDPADDDSPQEETEVQTNDVFEPNDVFEADGPTIPTYRCPKCGRPMKCVEFSFRPSWKDVMAKHRPAWYT